MNERHLTTASLAELHGTIARLLAKEDATPPAMHQHCVRETLDWRRQSDAFEAELARRGAPFRPTSW